MEDAADHAPIIDARFARLAARQMRFDHSPSFIRQPEQIRHLRPPGFAKPKRRLICPQNQEIIWVPNLAYEPINLPMVAASS
jgi:hypothetical protein